MTTAQVPRARYTSAEWAALELERMWPRVWHVACTVDHVSEPGDVFEYRCGPLSVLVVRGDDGVLRAFQNTCRHRGNAICEGAQQGLTELRCPFHRWAWDLAGNLREVPYRKLFGPLGNEELPLVGVRVDTWGPLVFVNLDTSEGAPSLADYLAPMPDDIAWAGVDDFRGVAMVTTPVRANWKVICDGFSETYHVQGIHPELNPTMDDTIPQRVWDHVGCSQQDYGVPNPRLAQRPADEAVWRSFVASQGARAGYAEDAPFPGGDVAEVLAEGIRKVQAQNGVDLTGFTTQQLLRLNQYNVFPNVTILLQPDLLSVLAGRPGPTNDPDEAEFVFFHFQRVPPGAPRMRPVDVAMPRGQADIGLVLNQDFGVMESMQRGLHQPGASHMVVSEFECRLLNTHRNLERYCGSGNF